MAFVDLRNVPRRLAQREAITFVVRDWAGHVGQSICAYAQSQEYFDSGLCRRGQHPSNIRVRSSGLTFSER
jgi:hypothetical protein